MKKDARGRELPDPTPVAMPLGFKRPPSIHELIRQAIRTEMSRHAAAQGAETFEESDDFDVDDREFDDVLTQYELKELHEEEPPPPAPEPAKAPISPPVEPIVPVTGKQDSGELPVKGDGDKP